MTTLVRTVVTLIPPARHITTVMEAVRTKLREQCLRDVSCYPEELVDTLRWFDYNWAEFEFRFVLAEIFCCGNICVEEYRGICLFLYDNFAKFLNVSEE